MAIKKEFEFYCPMDIVLFQQYANRGLFYPSSLAPLLEITKDKEMFSDIRLLDKLILFEVPTRINENDLVVKVRIPGNRFTKEKDLVFCDVILYQEAEDVLVNSKELENKYISLLSDVEAKFIRPTLKEDIRMLQVVDLKAPELDDNLLDRIVNFDRIMGAFGYVKNLEVLSFLEKQEKGSVCFPSRPWFTLLLNVEKKIWADLNDLRVYLKVMGLPNEPLLHYMLFPNEEDPQSKYVQLVSLLKILSKEELVVKGDQVSNERFFKELENVFHFELTNEARSDWENYIYGFGDIEKVLSSPEIKGNPYLKVLPLMSKYPSKSKIFNDSQAFKIDLLKNNSLFSKDELTGIGLFYGYYLCYSNLRERDMVGDRAILEQLPNFTSKYDDGLLSDLLWKVVFNEVFKLPISGKFLKQKVRFQHVDLNSSRTNGHIELSAWNGAGAYILRFNNEMEELKARVIELIKFKGGLKGAQIFLAYAILAKHRRIQDLDIEISMKKGFKIPEINEAFISFLENKDLQFDGQLIKKELELIELYAG
jgi:hypothetical protein